MHISPKVKLTLFHPFLLKRSVYITLRVIRSCTYLSTGMLCSRTSFCSISTIRHRYLTDSSFCSSDTRSEQQGLFVLLHLLSRTKSMLFRLLPTFANVFGKKIRTRASFNKTSTKLSEKSSMNVVYDKNAPRQQLAPRQEIISPCDTTNQWNNSTSWRQWQ